MQVAAVESVQPVIVNVQPAQRLIGHFVVNLPCLGNRAEIAHAAQQRIDLTSKTAYTAVGGEQAALPAGNKAASLTNASVYLDGKPLSLTAYSIGGNNYFKLRDLGDALGFGVDWNADTMTMILTVK